MNYASQLSDKAEADYLRNAQEAIAACRKATEVDPNYAEAYAMIGDLLRFDDKRRPEAIAALRGRASSGPSTSCFFGKVLAPVRLRLSWMEASNQPAKLAERVIAPGDGEAEPGVTAKTY